MEDVMIITIEEKEYKFEFDRKRIIKAEEVYAVNVSEMKNRIVSQSYRIWCAGLDKNHSNISVEARMDLFDKYNLETKKSMEVVGFLIERIASFINPTQANTVEENE